MPRAAVIIIQNGAVALIERHRAGMHYFLFPGGKAEDGETLEQAAVREAREEMRLEVACGQLVAQVQFAGTEPDRRDQFYFLATVTGGEFGPGDGPEYDGTEPAENGTYAPVWMPLMELEKCDVRPPAVAALVSSSLSSGWPEDAVQINEGDHA